MASKVIWLISMCTWITFIQFAIATAPSDPRFYLHRFGSTKPSNQITTLPPAAQPVFLGPSPVVSHYPGSYFIPKSNWFFPSVRLSQSGITEPSDDLYTMSHATARDGGFKRVVNQLLGSPWDTSQQELTNRANRETPGTADQFHGLKQLPSYDFFNMIDSNSE